MEENNSNEEFLMLIKKQKAARKRNFLIKLGCICFVFGVVFIYFALPVSHASNTSIDGNYYYSKKQILEIANVKSSNSLYFLNDKSIEEKLNASPLLGGNCKVSITPFGMKIYCDEKYPAYYVESDSVKIYYFNDGSIVSQDILNNDDELVGDFIKEHLMYAKQVMFSPDSIEKKELSNLNVILSNIDKDIKERIIFINYSSENSKYSVYLKSSDETSLLKIVFDCKSNTYLEGIPKAFSKNQIEILETKNCDSNKEIENGMTVYTHEIIKVEEDSKGLFYITFKKID